MLIIKIKPHYILLYMLFLLMTLSLHGYIGSISFLWNFIYLNLKERIFYFTFNFKASSF